MEDCWLPHALRYSTPVVLRMMRRLATAHHLLLGVEAEKHLLIRKSAPNKTEQYFLRS